jgi:hypothetical protein
MLQEIRIRTAVGAVAIDLKIRSMGSRYVTLLDKAEPRNLAIATINAVDTRGATIDQAAEMVIAALRCASSTRRTSHES